MQWKGKGTSVTPPSPYYRMQHMLHYHSLHWKVGYDLALNQAYHFIRYQCPCLSHNYQNYNNSWKRENTGNLGNIRYICLSDPMYAVCAQFQKLSISEVQCNTSIHIIYQYVFTGYPWESCTSWAYSTRLLAECNYMMIHCSSIKSKIFYYMQKKEEEMF